MLRPIGTIPRHIAHLCASADVPGREGLLQLLWLHLWSQLRSAQYTSIVSPHLQAAFEYMHEFLAIRFQGVLEHAGTTKSTDGNNYNQQHIYMPDHSQAIHKRERLGISRKTCKYRVCVRGAGVRTRAASSAFRVVSSCLLMPSCNLLASSSPIGSPIPLVRDGTASGPQSDVKMWRLWWEPYQNKRGTLSAGVNPIERPSNTFSECKRAGTIDPAPSLARRSRCTNGQVDSS